jgi:hypothetical protein
LYRQARQCHDAFVQIMAVPQRGHGASSELPGALLALAGCSGFAAIR